MLSIVRKNYTHNGRKLMAIMSVSFLWAFYSHALLAQELVLTTGINAPLVRSGDNEGFVESVVEEAFRRLGIKASIVSEPSKLSLINANRGKDDGVALRIFGIEQIYKNLIRVPEVIMCSEFVAYSTVAYPDISSWSDLSGYNVSYVNGWRIFENNVANEGRVIKSDSAEFLFSMLRENKTEFVLYEKWQGSLLAESKGISSVVKNKLPIRPKKMYIYLHKKHSHLIDGVAMSMRKMKSDGTYQKIYNNTLKKYASSDQVSGYKANILSGCE